jgi:hypothetical protein
MSTVQIWGSSSLLESTTLLLMVEFFDINSGQAIDATARSITLKPNQSTELDELPLPNQEDTIVAARLLELDTGIVVSRCHDWPQPYVCAVKLEARTKR